MKVIIAGSRNYDNYAELKAVCDHMFSKTENVEIVSGTAQGADTLGEIYSRLVLKKEATKFPAAWNDVLNKPHWAIGRRDNQPYYKLAGHARNEEMAKYADAAIIFWDGKSAGTKNMISLAKKYNLKLRIHQFKKHVTKNQRNSQTST